MKAARSEERAAWLCSGSVASSVGLVDRDTHLVEACPDEVQGSREQREADPHLECLVLDGEHNLNGQESKEGGELDHRVEADRGGVLEGISDGVADHGRRVQLSALGAHVHFHDLLGVVPCSTGVRHEDCLEQAEERDANQVTDEEHRAEEGQTKREAEDRQEDVPHATLCVDGADLHNFLTVLDARLGLVKVDVLLDEDHRAVCACDNGLRRCAREPVDHCAAHEKAEQNFWSHDAQDALDVLAFWHDHLVLAEGKDDAEDHRGCTNDCGTNEHWLGSGLKGIACAVALLKKVLGVLEIGMDAVIALQLFLDVGDCFNAAQFKHALCVVGHWSEAVDRDRHWAHAQEAECNQTERKDRCSKVAVRIRHEPGQVIIATEFPASSHQHQDQETCPESTEIACNESGQDVEAGAALCRGLGHFVHVLRAGACQL